MTILQAFLEQNRQTGSTTSLIELTKQTNGLLIVGNRNVAYCISRNHPDIKNNILTIHDIETGKARGMRPKQIFFDTTAIQYMTKKE